MCALRILVLDNYDSFTFNLVHLLEQFTDEVEVFRNDEIDLEQVNDYEKILLSPGPSLPADAGIMMDLIDRYHKEKSILGICLGMQGIVQYFGGELFNLDEVKHGIVEKVKVADVQESFFKNVSNPFEVGLYHSWATKRELLPRELLETANSNGITMGVSHMQYAVKGVQFHPESIMTPEGKQMIFNWINE